MDELKAAAMAHGVKDGAQMARFMIWVGEECFEGRQEPNFKTLSARAKSLVEMFLGQDGKNVAKEGRPA
jgi:hypothetical protein